MKERWKNITNFPGYQVSNTGRQSKTSIYTFEYIKGGID